MSRCPESLGLYTDMPVKIVIKQDNTQKVIMASEEAIAKALETVGFQAERNAKKEISNVVYNTPQSPSGYKRTGLLRNSITFALDGEPANVEGYKADDGSKTGSYSGQAPKEGKGKRAVYIGTNVEYAPYVETGTSRMKARPFLKPAIQDHIDEYKTILKEELEKA